MSKFHINSFNTCCIIRYDMNEYSLENKQIVGFGFENTIVVQKSGKKFITGINDWTYLSTRVNNQIKKATKDKVVLFVEHSESIKKNKITLNLFIDIAKNILIKLDIPCILFVSWADDMNMKPRIGILDVLNIRKDQFIFFCGGYGGYPNKIKTIDNKIIKSDKSDIDLKFAKNLNTSFIHRNEIFYGIKMKEQQINYPFDPFNIEYTKNDFIFKPSDNPEMIIMVGCPGSGKSTFSLDIIKKYKNYNWINRDTLNNMTKCIDYTKKSMDNMKNVIIDNTNPTKKSRKSFLNLAELYSYDVRIIYINVDPKIAQHNTLYRYLIGCREKIPKIVWNVYMKKFETPTKDESTQIVDIIELPFQFRNNNDILYCTYLE